ncbi:MAG: hypothetical protein SNH35_04540 [Rikenellaceae bacterium]
MTIFDLLYFNRELLGRLWEVGINTSDHVYVDLYRDYVNMSKNGDKKTYIVATLASRYSISERKVYYIIERLGKGCKTPAV